MTHPEAPRDIIAEGERYDEAVTGADPGPVDELDMAAADGLSVTEEQAAHYREMTERGAAQPGDATAP